MSLVEQANLDHREKPACGVLPTVFVTVPALEVTKTVVISFDAVLSDTNIKTTPVSVQSLTDITTTVTNYLTLTQVINLVQATSTSIETSSTSSAVNQVPIAPTSIGSLPVLDDTIIRFQSTLASVKPSLTSAQATKDVIIPDQGPYYFTVNHGTTFWLNNRTPPGGVSYKTSTTVVTLEPVPLRSSDLAEASVEPTTYSTLSLTTVITRFSTVEILKVLPTPTISAKLSVSLGSTGWNATTATLLEHEVGGTLAKSTLQQTVVQKEVAAHPKLQGILPASTYPVNATKTLNIRQIGSTVIATIAGVVVSWINDFTGASETSVPVTTINGAPTPENILTTGKLLLLRGSHRMG